jgi:hypothetical protein
MCNPEIIFTLLFVIANQKMHRYTQVEGGELLSASPTRGSGVASFILVAGGNVNKFGYEACSYLAKQVGRPANHALVDATDMSGFGPPPNSAMTPWLVPLGQVAHPRRLSRHRILPFRSPT